MAAWLKKRPVASSTSAGVQRDVARASYDVALLYSGAGGKFHVTMDRRCVDDSADKAILLDEAGVLISAQLPDEESLLR